MAKDSPEMHKFRKRQRLKRQLWCAFYAKEAFRNVKNSAEKYIEMKLTKDHPLHFTFVSSVTITYSRFFIGSDTMITLPSSFEEFPKQRLKFIHDEIKSARNRIYAHTDATAALYSVRLDIEVIADNVLTYVKGSTPDLKHEIFSDLVELCNFQIERVQKHLLGIVQTLIPPDALNAILPTHPPRKTTVNVYWPKAIDPNMTVPPNTW